MPESDKSTLKIDVNKANQIYEEAKEKHKLDVMAVTTAQVAVKKAEEALSNLPKGKNYSEYKKTLQKKKKTH